MNYLTTPIKNILSSLTSASSLVGDSINGVIGVGSKVKQFIDTETEYHHENLRVSNTADQIISKSKQVKKIAKELGITYQEAEKLLNKELTK